MKKLAAAMLMIALCATAAAAHGHHSAPCEDGDGHCPPPPVVRERQTQRPDRPAPQGEQLREMRDGERRPEMGPRGERGPKGPGDPKMGPRGAQGPRGPQGPRDPKMGPAPRGPQGPRGHHGPRPEMRGPEGPDYRCDVHAPRRHRFHRFNGWNYCGEFDGEFCPEPFQQQPRGEYAPIPGPRILGFSVQPQQRTAEGYMIVDKVTPATAAAYVGIKSGAVIYSIDGNSTAQVGVDQLYAYAEKRWTEDATIEVVFSDGETQKTARIKL